MKKPLFVIKVRFNVLYPHYNVITKQKEEITMKSSKMNHRHSDIYRHYHKPYPNAADPGYFVDKLIDGIVSVITGLGCVTFFLFLFTM